MSPWRAFTQRASDLELLRLGQSLSASVAWCFVESATVSEFLELADLERHISTAWLVRAFGETCELAARRIDFTSSSPWLVRLIGQTPPLTGEWQEHSLEDGETSRMVLCGVSDARGRFIEGRQFRDPFAYPGLLSGEGQRASLTVRVHPVDRGEPVVRWLALQVEGGGNLP